MYKAFPGRNDINLNVHSDPYNFMISQCSKQRDWGELGYDKIKSVSGKYINSSSNSHTFIQIQDLHRAKRTQSLSITQSAIT